MGSVSVDTAADFAFAPTLRTAKRLQKSQRPKTNPGVVVKLDLPSTDAANKTPAMFADDVAQLRVGKGADNAQLRRMRHEIFRLYGEHPRYFRDHRRQLLVHLPILAQGT